MGAVVEFDYGAWQTRYPEFNLVSRAMATAYFTEATIFHRNDGRGPVRDPAQQLLLLNMLTAHIAMLSAGNSQQPATPLVGRIETATEGSVTVNADMGQQPPQAAYYLQTKYGAAYWSATRQFRRARYRPGPQRMFDFPFFIR